MGPVNAVLKKWNKELKDTKKSLERADYLARKKECEDVHAYYTAELREKNFNSKQYKLLSEMAAAEVIKATLPNEIKAMQKALIAAETARELREEQKAIGAVRAKLKRKQDREAAAAKDGVTTPELKRARK